MDWAIVATVVVRAANAILWTLVCIRILQHDRPIARLARQLFVTIIVAGMWILVMGPLTQAGFLDLGVARVITTAFTAYAAIVALAIWTTDILDD